MPYTVRSAALERSSQIFILAGFTSGIRVICTVNDAYMRACDPRAPADWVNADAMHGYRIIILGTMWHPSGAP